MVSFILISIIAVMVVMMIRVEKLVRDEDDHEDGFSQSSFLQVYKHSCIVEIYKCCQTCLDLVK